MVLICTLRNTYTYILKEKKEIGAVTGIKPKANNNEDGRADLELPSKRYYCHCEGLGDKQGRVS